MSADRKLKKKNRAMKDYDTANNTDDNIPLQEDEDTAEVMRIAEELKRIQEEEDEEEGRGWDGSEAELVEDDDAEEYEIPMAGIRVSYVLTEEEYFKCLKHSGIYKSQGTRGLIEAVVLGILAVIFFVVFFMAGGVSNIVFGCISLIFIAVLLVVPNLHMRSMAKSMADGKLIEAEIYPDSVEIGRDDGAWKIELDGTSRIQEFDNIIMIFADHNRSFAIPERAIDPDFLPEIKGILLAGTIPTYEED